ncbi:MAG: hypothetical protein IJJ84_12385 [Kiritimatiellae bacterium]|nr:hypothetical protein [Kiritimatiellia bacterium]
MRIARAIAAAVVAGVSFVAYLIAPFVGSAWIALPVALLLLFTTLFVFWRFKGSR